MAISKDAFWLGWLSASTLSYMRSGASVHMTTEQILPLIVVTFIFIDISEYLYSYDYDVQLLCD